MNRTGLLRKSAAQNFKVRQRRRNGLNRIAKDLPRRAKSSNGKARQGIELQRNCEEENGIAKVMHKTG